ncbi:hypothetical protein HDG70_001772 [Carboxydothermus ferrireducens DSM 11255]|nr:hypothetical protein [Carboxydothermus ferrireducens DSM 11255]
MPELIKLNIQDLLDKILPVLKTYPQIEAA